MEFADNVPADLAHLTGEQFDRLTGHGDESLYDFAGLRVDHTPAAWIESIYCASQCDDEKPIRMELFRGLDAKGVLAVAHETTDALHLLTLALNDPDKWALVACRRIADLARDSKSYQERVESLVDEYRSAEPEWEAA